MLPACTWYGAIHWRMDDLSGATPIKKVSVASQLRIRLKNLSPAPDWNVVWLDLIQIVYRQTQLLWIDEFMSQGHYFILVFLKMWLFQSFSAPSMNYLRDGKGAWYKCSISGWALHSNPLFLDHLWVSALTTVQRDLSDEDWVPPTYISLEVSLLLYSFNRILVIGSHMGSVSSLTIGVGQIYSTRY